MNALAQAACEALFLLALSVSMYWLGHHNEAQHCEAVRTQERAAAQDAYNRMEQHYIAVKNDLAEQLMEQQDATTATTKEVERIVERPVYRNVCLDADGLRLVNEALLGVHTAPPSNGHTVLRRVDPARNK